VLLDAALAAMPIAATWVIAMVVPLTSGAFFPVAGAELVADAHTTTFTEDPISVLSIDGGAWVVQPWIPALVMRVAFEWFDLAGLVILQGLLAAVLTALLWRLARAHASPAAAAGAVVVAMILLWPSAVRTEQFALIVAAALLLCLRSRWWFAAPALLVLWANVHGSVPIGLFLVACAAVGIVRAPGHRGRMPLLRAGVFTRVMWLLACVVAVFVNPLGIELVGYIRDVQGIPVLEQVTPLWQSLSPVSSRGLLVIAVMCLLLYVNVRRRSWSNLLPLVPVLVLAVATFSAARYASWLALVASVELAAALQWSFESRGVRGRLTSPIVAVTVLAPLAIGVLLLLPGTDRQERLARIGVPHARLLAGIEDEDVVLTSAEWADYVYLRTGARVVVDARLERFHARDLNAYLDFVRRADLSLVRRSGADVVIVHDRTLGPAWEDARATVTGGGVRLRRTVRDDTGTRYDVVSRSGEQPTAAP
jgi:hypothetical protein